MTSTVVRRFHELSPQEAYAVWRLRQDVFVIEQQAAYPDLDGRDAEPGTRHVLLLDDTLIGTARVLDDGENWRVGRLCLARAARGQGLSGVLMSAALALTEDRDVVLDAQSALSGWYAAFGFLPDGPEFLEDEIPHTPMRLSRETATS